MRPLDPLTLREAAEILGCTTSTVHRYVMAGRLPRIGDQHEPRTLSRADVEQLACERYRWYHHIHDGESYWVTGQNAADVLGVSTSRLKQLAEADRVPFVRHRDGTRLYRRHQLEIVSQARDARWH